MTLQGELCGHVVLAVECRCGRTVYCTCLGVGAAARADVAEVLGRGAVFVAAFCFSTRV